MALFKQKCYMHVKGKLMHECRDLTVGDPTVGTVGSKDNIPPAQKLLFANPMSAQDVVRLTEAEIEKIRQDIFKAAAVVHQRIMDDEKSAVLSKTF